MTLIEQATEEARHCACGHDGDCYHFKVLAALETADLLAIVLAAELPHAPILAAYRAATKGEG